MCQVGQTSKPIILRSCPYCTFPSHSFSGGINSMAVEEFDLLDEERLRILHFNNLKGKDFIYNSNLNVCPA